MDDYDTEIIGEYMQPLEVITAFTAVLPVFYTGDVEISFRTYELDELTTMDGIIESVNICLNLSEMVNVLYYTEIEERVKKARGFYRRYGDKRTWLRRAAEDKGFDVVSEKDYVDNTLSRNENKKEIRDMWKKEVWR